MIGFHVKFGIFIFVALNLLQLLETYEIIDLYFIVLIFLCCDLWSSLCFSFMLSLFFETLRDNVLL